MTVVVIALIIAVLAVYLFVIGGLLNRTAINLSDCLQSLRTVAGRANNIGPGVKRLNETGGELLGALPLLLEDADGVAGTLAPSAVAQAAPPTASASPAAASTTQAASAGPRASVGYLDPAPATGVGT